MLRATSSPKPDWWLMTAGKQEKRKAYWEGKDGGRETMPFSLDNSTGLISGWFRQNGKYPMTVWEGEVKLTTELGTELTVKKVNHASRCYVQSRLTRLIWAWSRITLRSHHASRKPPLPPWYFICGVLPIDMIEDLIETFYDEDENFPVRSSAHVRTNVILAGKCDSHRHSTTNFSKNVVVEKTSYQMLGMLTFSDRERALPPSTVYPCQSFLIYRSGILILPSFFVGVR